MKRLGLAVLSLFLLAISLVKAQDVSSQRKIEFTVSPGPASPDWVEMITRYNDPKYDWSKARGEITTIKFYEGNLRVESPWNTGVNSFLILQRSGVFSSVTRNLNLETSMESGAIKPGDCLKNKTDIDRSAIRVVDSVRNAYQSGGNVSSVAVDTAGINCGYSKAEAGRIVGLWSVRVEQLAFNLFSELKVKLPDVRIVPLGIGDIEPYPAMSAFEHVAYIDAMMAERSVQGFAPIKFYDIDIDTKQLTASHQAALDFDIIASHLHGLGIKVGLIVNGDDSKLVSMPDASNETLHSALQKLVFYKRLGLFDQVDRVTIQSWATRQTGVSGQPLAFDIPWNVPEDRPSLTWLVNRIVGCIRETESCEFP